MLVVTTALASVHQPTGRGVAWWQDFVITSLAVHGKVGGDYWAAGLDQGGSVHGKVGEGQNAQFQLSSYWSQYNTWAMRRERTLSRIQIINFHNYCDQDTDFSYWQNQIWLAFFQILLYFIT